MISNYIKIVLRAIQQNKLSYFLNLFGLSIGIASFLFIFYYVNFELGYDKFNDRQDLIYRVGLDQFKNNELIFESAENYPAVGPALQESFPEVVDFTRLYNAGAKNNVVFYRPEEEGKQGYKVRRFLYADSSFFRIFSFPLLKGDPKTCLSQSKSAVISRSFAEKVFKGEDPMGQSIVMADDDFNQEICKITGVFEDVPYDSHLKFDVLASYSSLMTRGRNAVERYDQSWDEKDMYTYVLLKDGTDPLALEAKFPQFMDQHNPELLMMNQEKKIFLQPLSSIHLDSHLADEAEQNGQKQNVLTLVLVGGLILLVAMVNFLNYTVAKSMTRAKDFGLRKTMGAVKKDLYLQFIFEALFHNILAIAFAAGIVVVCLPFFKDLTQLETNSFSEFFLNRSFLYAVGGTLAAGLIFGGLAPALILNNYDLIEVVKGRIMNFGKGLFLRRVLLTLQIAASTALTAMFLLVINQINFLTNYDLGIDIDNVFVVDRPGTGAKDFRSQRDNFILFRNKLAADQHIESVCGSSVIPGKRIRWRASLYNYGDAGKNTHQVDLAAVDENFFEAYNLDLIAGRGFSLDRAMDADTNIVLSRKATKLLGYDNPEDAVGKTVVVEEWEWSPNIIGVVEDYHQLSLRENTHPTLYMFTVNLAEYYMIKVKPENTAAALGSIERTWESVFPGNPFSYYYLESFFSEQYASDKVFSRIMLVFATISILISCISLFNISLFALVQRTREIGIRKTLGASRWLIAWIFVRDYLIMIAVGSLIAFPLAYLFGKEWLANFVYSISINAWYFVIAFASILFISLITISFYTLRSTRINPVEALRYQN